MVWIGLGYMKKTVVIYEKSTCSKCRLAEKILKSRGIEFEKVLYHKTPLSEKKLKELLKKMEMSAEDLLRKNENVYKEKVRDKNLSEKELIAVMVENPDLIQRPII